MGPSARSRRSRLRRNGGISSAGRMLDRVRQLKSSAQVIYEELRNRAECFDVIVAAGEGVAFVGEDQVRHVDPARPEPCDDLIRLGLRNTRVVSALDHEQ